MSRFSPLLITLIVSLIVNALLVGLLLGGMLGNQHHQGRRGPGGGDPDFAIARGIQSVVPDSERQQIREAFRRAFFQSRELIAEKREAQSRLTAALVASPFEQADVDQAFADIRDADAELKQRFQTILAEELARMEPSEREALGQWLQQIEERYGRRGGPRGDGERGWRRPPPEDGPPPPPEP